MITVSRTLRNALLSGVVSLLFASAAHGGLDGSLRILDAPTAVEPGQRFNATFRLTNTGTVPLQSGGTTPDRLGSWTPENNQTWNAGRVNLNADIAPGQSVDITETFTAPATSGVLPFAWRCVRELVTWFCGTATVSIAVGAAPRAAATLPPAPVPLPGSPLRQPPPPSGVELGSLPQARVDGSLVSASIIDTRPYTADGIAREAVWVNKSGRDLEIHQIYLWSGVDIGTRADVHADVRRGSDQSILAILQWDRYAEPTAPNNSAVFRFDPPYMRIPQGDSINLNYRIVSFNGNQYHGHHVVIIWTR